MWEAIVPPGGGPPPHVHSREEEGFYILEGEITFQIGDERVVAKAGVFANMPVGTPHSFKNESSKPAKMLISVAPAGLEELFFEFGVPLPQGSIEYLPDQPNSRRGGRPGWLFESVVPFDPGHFRIFFRSGWYLICVLDECVATMSVTCTSYRDAELFRDKEYRKKRDKLRPQEHP